MECNLQHCEHRRSAQGIASPSDTSDVCAYINVCIRGFQGLNGPARTSNATHNVFTAARGSCHRSFQYTHCIHATYVTAHVASKKLFPPHDKNIRIQRRFTWHLQSATTAFKKLVYVSMKQRSNATRNVRSTKVI